MQHTSFVPVTFISETSGLIRIISVSEQMRLRATNIQSVSYHISYHLFSFHRSVQDYIIRMDMEIIVFVGIKGWH